MKNLSIYVVNDVIVTEARLKYDMLIKKSSVLYTWTKNNKHLALPFDVSESLPDLFFRSHSVLFHHAHPDEFGELFRSPE